MGIEGLPRYVLRRGDRESIAQEWYESQGRRLFSMQEAALPKGLAKH